MAEKKKELFVPLDINLTKFLPKYESRAYTKLEAMYSVSIDYFKNNPVSCAGYSRLWKWSRKKVNKFMNDIGVEIFYESSTKEKQNQRGQIRVQIGDRSGTDKEQMRFINLRNLEVTGDRSGTDKEQIGDRSGNNTNKKEIMNNKKEIKKSYSEPFERLRNDYPNKEGSKAQAFKNYETSKKKLKLTDEQIYKAAMNSAKKQKLESKGGEVYYYRLSNVLGEKYRNDLPDLLNYVIPEGNGSTKRPRIVDPKENEFRYPSNFDPNGPSINEKFDGYDFDSKN
jgi:hypothetical protein